MISKTVLVLLLVCAMVLPDSNAAWWSGSRRRFWQTAGQVLDTAAKAAGQAAINSVTEGKRELDNQENPSPAAMDDFYLLLAHNCPVVEQNYGTLSDDEEIMNCQDGIQSGLYPNLKGLKAIMPVNASAPINVLCEQSVQHWIFRRWHNNLDFNTTKADYVNGIGSGSEYSDYWVGLENLHILTTRNPYTYILGVQINNLTQQQAYHQIFYSGFKVRSAAEGYSMTFTSTFTTPNSIPMGDCFSPLKDIPFSAFDDDNDGNPSRNCAADYGGGWWYNASCSECNVVGPIRRDNLTRIPGAVNELFWLPGIEPQDYSPGSVFMYLFRW